ncbi:ABC transporter permease [Reinekea blandensis]|uniref:Ribose ABC transporter permease n=1 Tax=Reinekea blandensis MED297 TaxID=314283 RepID=A4BIG1_9GAMM|nr:ABC transporter permease [Reinekea blandensis]EAR08040.1 ribose ABC transporter permease [Reinekea sp. MED297] [Reinekea blandensis MED297]
MTTQMTSNVNPLMRVIKRIDFATYAPLIALVVLFIASSIASEYFLNARNITNILRQVSYTGIIAIGATFVIIAAGIDLSVGSMVALVGVVTMFAINSIAGDVGGVFFGIAVALVFGAALGAINGVMVTKGRVTAFIVTLATMSIFRSVALYLSDAGEVVGNNNLYPEIGGGYFMGVPFPVWVFFLLAVFAHILLRHTAYGRHVCAVGSNPNVARYSAIPVERVIFLTFVIAGFCVGVSAVLLSSRLNSVAPGDMGAYFELDAIAAVVIGGTSLAGGRGTIVGTVIGALILGIINNMLNLLGVSAYLQGLVKGLVILIAVLLQYKNNK